MEKEIKVIETTPKQKKPKKKKKTKFWKIYKLFICIFLVIIVVLLAVLFSSLYKYEKKMQLQEEALETSESETTDIFENDSVTQQDELTAGIAQSGDGKQIAVVCPTNYTLTVDGQQVHGSSVFQTADLPAKAYFEEYIPEGESFPSMAAYSIENASDAPVVECRDALGNKVPALKDTFPFYQFDVLSEEPSAEIKNYYGELVVKYVKYCLNEGDRSSVSPYFLSGTSTYSDISKIEEVKQYSGRKTGYNIGEVSFSNYQRYTDYAYRIQLNFTYTVSYNDTTRDNPTTLDCYVANVGGQWKIVHMNIS